MNFPLLTAVTQSDLPPLQRLLLVMLLNHANSHGKAWPSHATLARETGLAVRSVGAHMRCLEQAGWLVRLGGRDSTGKAAGVGVFTVSCPAHLLPAEVPTLPLDQASPAYPRRQHLPTGSARLAEGSAAPAEGVGIPCRQTTHEPTNIHPLNHQEGKQEEGKPPPGVKGSKSKKAEWREWNSRQAEAANAVASTTPWPPDLDEAWARYRDYRTRRATEARVASEAVAWTADAAAAALRSCERHGAAHGWAAVVAQIDTAIAGHWQGLNFPAATRTSSSSGGGRNAAYQTKTATAGYTTEELLTFMPEPRF